MKKTLLAIFATAFVASSAQAVTVLDLENTGTKVDFTGSARVKWTSEANKTSRVGQGTKRNHENQAVDNNGSRFGFKATQQLGDGFYALGRVEWRFRGTDNRGVDAQSQHNFDHVYTHQLYAGIGHKEYGELTYGNMTTITDEVKQTDLANTLSLSDGLLTSSARRAVQYTYKNEKEGIKAGAFYGATSPRDNKGLSIQGKERKDVWGFGAIWALELDDVQSIKTAVGVTRDRYYQIGLPEYDRKAFAFGSAYTYGATTFGLDLERRETEDQGAVGNKRTEKEVRTVVYHKITNDLRAYTMYAYKDNKLVAKQGNDTKFRRHQFMLGSEYYIVPKYLKTFVEWQTSHGKRFVNGNKVQRVRDNTTVIGLRAYW